MDGKQLNKKRLWLCAKGHALGYIRQHKINYPGAQFAYRVTMIYIFSTAIDMQAEAPAQVRISGRVRAANGMQWTCSVCGAMREWHERKNVYIDRVTPNTAETESLKGTEM